MRTNLRQRPRTAYRLSEEREGQQVHVHPSRLIVALLGLLGACRTEARQPERAVPPVKAGVHSAPPKVAVSDERTLCAGRPRCAVSKRQAVSGPADAELVVVRLGHSADAGADEDRCDRREYWLSLPPAHQLVARDCEVQWGADTAGPAEVTVKDARLDIRYLEFQSDDRCEMHRATIDVNGPKVVEQSRTVGSVVKSTCVPGRGSVALPPMGDGSPSRPLLTLHRE